MEIKVEIERLHNVPNPKRCWKADVKYDGKAVAIVSEEVLKKAAEFAKASPFKNRNHLNIQFYDYVNRQVREERTNSEFDVIYKIDNEIKQNLQLFLSGLIFTAQKEDVVISASYLGKEVNLHTLKEAKIFVDSL